MTKKDYQKAAAIIKRHVGAMARMDQKKAEDMHTTLVSAFTTFFHDDNPRFDELRFREACNPA